MTWDSFELAAIEEGIWNDLDTLAEDGELKASEQTAFVRTTTGRVGAKTHDFEDFGSRRDLRPRAAGCHSKRASTQQSPTDFRGQSRNPGA